jgi:hypothetical protein
MPVSLVMVIVAEPEPVPVQGPVAVMATARPELEVASTGKVAVFAAIPGAAVVIVIVWLA